ncbi:MAG: hypothetical protein WBH85_11310 [Thermoanaerobaculia bacterium]
MPEGSTRGGRRLFSSLWLVTVVARAYTEVGFLAELDWARFSYTLFAPQARNPEYAGFYLVERGRSRDPSDP